MSTSYVKIRKALKEEIERILPSISTYKKVELLNALKNIWDKYLLEKSYLLKEELILEKNVKLWVYSNPSGTYFSDELVKKIGNEKVTIIYCKKDKRHYLIIGRGEYIKDGKISKGMKTPSLSKSIVGSAFIRKGRLCYNIL